MPVFTSFAKQLFRAGLREAQDVLAECADVTFVELEAAGDVQRRTDLLARLSRYRSLSALTDFNPGLRPIRLDRDYDLFLAVCPYWRDVGYLNAIKNWRDRCCTAICWIDELWISEVRTHKHWERFLRDFDHIIIGVSGTAEVLAQTLGRPVHELAGAVDALRFSPRPHHPARCVDVYSIGRRLDSVHDAIRRTAEERGLFYVYDTAVSGNSEAPSYRAHREMYANVAKRSKLFVVAPGKVNVSRQTAGQADIGFRCFEGLAAGCVLIGQSPDSELFRKLFDWPRPIEELRPDGSDTAQVVASLLADGAALAEASARNVEHALLRHDWIYRWREAFAIAGYQPAPGMLAREHRLRELAATGRREGQ